MIKVTYKCDKCTHEDTAEIAGNTHVATKPNEWSMPEVKTGKYSSIRILLCPECADKAGFNKSNEPSGNYDEKQTAAEKLVDILFEIAEERGVFNGE